MIMDKWKNGIDKKMVRTMFCWHFAWKIESLLDNFVETLYFCAFLPSKAALSFCHLPQVELYRQTDGWNTAPFIVTECFDERCDEWLTNYRNFYQFYFSNRFADWKTIHMCLDLIHNLPPRFTIICQCNIKQCLHSILLHVSSNGTLWDYFFLQISPSISYFCSELANRCTIWKKFYLLYWHCSCYPFLPIVQNIQFLLVVLKMII